MNSKYKNLTVYAVLTAIMIIMSFTHLGYIKLAVAEITLMSVPVIVGIAFSGIRGGLITGTVFGVTSFIQCFGMSAFGAALLSVNPVLMFILCVGTRVLMGLICGLIYDTMRKHNVKKLVNYIVLSVLSPLINTVFFVTTLMLFFGNSDYIRNIADSLGAQTVASFVIAMFGLNAVLEIALCVVVGPAICKALEKAKALD